MSVGAVRVRVQEWYGQATWRVAQFRDVLGLRVPGVSTLLLVYINRRAFAVFCVWPPLEVFRLLYLI